MDPKNGNPHLGHSRVGSLGLPEFAFSLCRFFSICFQFIGFWELFQDELKFVPRSIVGKASISPSQKKEEPESLLTPASFQADKDNRLYFLSPNSHFRNSKISQAMIKSSTHFLEFIFPFRLTSDRSSKLLQKYQSSLYPQGRRNCRLSANGQSPGRQSSFPASFRSRHSYTR